MMRRAGCLFLMLLLCGPARAITWQGDSGIPVILAVGGSFVYARDNQGQVWVWGDNQFGQLGRGSAQQSFQVRKFSTRNSEIDLLRLKDIVPASDYSFLWMDDNTVYGVGNNAYLPLTVKGSFLKTHVRVDLNEEIADIKAGFGHVLALTVRGEVLAWGRNSRGQIGNGNHANTKDPYKLPLENIVRIAAGGKFSLALDHEGMLWGWGDNEYRFLDPGTSADRTIPVRIDTGDIRIAGMDACGASIVLLDESGVLWTWGRNDMYQLGYDTGGETGISPRAVPLPLAVTDVAAYSSQTYAILEDGSLWSWGNNSYGQLGQGFRSSSTQGVLPGKAWDKDVVLVMGGSLFVFAMTRDGTLLSSGISKFGQLGRGDSKSVYTLSPTGLDLIKP